MSRYIPTAMNGRTLYSWVVIILAAHAGVLRIMLALRVLLMFISRWVGAGSGPAWKKSSFLLLMNSEQRARRKHAKHSSMVSRNGMRTS